MDTARAVGVMRPPSTDSGGLAWAGLGKTVQALGVLAHYQEHWPALIVVPSNLRRQWRDEMVKFLPELLQEADIRLIENGKAPLDGERGMGGATTTAWPFSSDGLSAGTMNVISYDLMTKLADTGVIRPGRFKVSRAHDPVTVSNPPPRLPADQPGLLDRSGGGVR
jgi:hypothetical protein